MTPEPAERNRLLSQLQRQLRERLAPLLQALFDENTKRHSAAMVRMASSDSRAGNPVL